MLLPRCLLWESRSGDPDDKLTIVGRVGSGRQSLSNRTPARAGNDTEPAHRRRWLRCGPLFVRSGLSTLFRSCASRNPPYSETGLANSTRSLSAAPMLEIRSTERPTRRFRCVDVITQQLRGISQPLRASELAKGREDQNLHPRPTLWPCHRNLQRCPKPAR